MSFEIPLVEIARLKEILLEVTEARSELQTCLNLLQKSLAEATQVAQESDASQNALESQLRSLERELESVKRQLGKTRFERDKA